MTWTTQKLKVRRLQVIFKVVERCNLACSYCYYFFGGDQSYKERPARASLDIAKQLDQFLRDSVAALDINEVDIVFHGGEPMLQRIGDFDQMCARFKAIATPNCRVNLAIQTNGTRFSPEWNKILVRHRIAIGISVDGPPEVNDPNRPFHNGKGSTATIERGLALLRSDDRDFFNRRVGSLTVLDAAQDYRQAIDYFVDVLGITTQGYLLPDCSHDDGIPGDHSARDYGSILCSIFDAWVERGDLSVREIANLLRRFQKAYVSESGRAAMKRLAADRVQILPNHVLVVHSNGDLKVDDSYIPAAAWQQAAPVANLASISLEAYLRDPCFEELYTALKMPPDECAGCRWLAICGGGDLENRWSSDKRFNNPSIFCEGLKMFYERIVSYLIQHGYPAEDIATRLTGEYDPFVAGYAA